MKRQLMEWEKIFANDMINKGLSKIYKHLIQFNINKIHNPTKKKWTEDLNRDYSISIRRKTDRQGHEKMLSITNYQRNAN